METRRIMFIAALWMLVWSVLCHIITMKCGHTCGHPGELGLFSPGSRAPNLGSISSETLSEALVMPSISRLSRAPIVPSGPWAAVPAGSHCQSLPSSFLVYRTASLERDVLEPEP